MSSSRIYIYNQAGNLVSTGALIFDPLQRSIHILQMALPLFERVKLKPAYSMVPTFFSSPVDFRPEGCGQNRVLAIYVAVWKELTTGVSLKDRSPLQFRHPANLYLAIRPKDQTNATIREYTRQSAYEPTPWDCLGASALAKLYHRRKIQFRITVKGPDLEKAKVFTQTQTLTTLANTELGLRRRKRKRVDGAEVDNDEFDMEEDDDLSQRVEAGGAGVARDRDSCPPKIPHTPSCQNATMPL